MTSRFRKPRKVAFEGERTIAKLRAHPRRFVLGAVVLIVGAWPTVAVISTGELPQAALIAIAYALVAALLLVVPWVRWVGATTVITTHRLRVRRGVFKRVRLDYTHVSGYAHELKRGFVQKMFGTGTITISSTELPGVVLRDLPDAVLVDETLAEQIGMRIAEARSRGTARSIVDGVADAFGYVPKDRAQEYVQRDATR